jgi:primosomal protein N' (replication factor Y)
MVHSKLYVDVILPLRLQNFFTYKVPDNLKKQIKPGIRIIVQFGSKKLYSAIIRRIHTDEPKGYTTKCIVSILDEKPVITDIQFLFWEWLSDYYMCSPGEVMNAALPPGLKLESQTQVILNRQFIYNQQYTPSETQILNILEDNKGLSIKEISKRIGKKNILPVINELINKKAVLPEETIHEKFKPRLEAFVEKHPDITEERLNEILDQLEKAPNQLNILVNYINLSGFSDFKDFKPVKKKFLLRQASGGISSLNTLVKKKILILKQQEVSRLSSDIKAKASLKKLNTTQLDALSQIKQLFSEKNVVLLHGVTSSGKTEIYMHLIKEQLKKGKQILYLLPEIALTAQIINRLRDVFGNKVGVYHSKFSDAERQEIWYNILDRNKKDTYRIILGVRSSVFLPFKNLGLVIVDEEHENTYKQTDPAPRYHARDSAIMLANFFHAKTVLGTATPAIDTYFNTTTGKFGLVEIHERFEKIELPEVILVNTREAYKKRQMTSFFSNKMLTEINNALKRKEQVILFQNRRGFSPFIECENCGWIPGCKNCSVRLTYHKSNNNLVCHYCSYSIPNPGKCISCGSTLLKTKGFGTEKIEDEINLLFPGAKTERMDLDTTRTKRSYEKIISNFENNNINILVGTQMISKGLDFSNVSIVGILNADNLLKFPDFRAYERSFQLMAQVSGRAGRKYKQGKVIIQTSDPNHTIIQDVLNNDFQHMFLSQLNERKKFKYPPFFRIIEITLKHRKRPSLNKAAKLLSDDLRKFFGERVLGPEFPVISQVYKWYFKTIILKIEKGKKVSSAKQQILSLINWHEKTPEFRSAQILINVDPM